MAREPRVTRTILTTEVTVLFLDVTTGNSFDKTVVLPRTYKDDKEIIKLVRATYDNEKEKAVYVKSSEVKETLYGMTEQKFIQCAEILPPRPAKSNANTDETVSEEANN